MPGAPGLDENQIPSYARYLLCDCPGSWLAGEPPRLQNGKGARSGIRTAESAGSRTLAIALSGDQSRTRKTIRLALKSR
ncbi:hypothetical protein Y1Q_0005716 [Alligator mississippiensis]|uniref:Uncharacterized protein n=1 Tax=Alligator mississippiensis TaxID=8496 RepID=A0A151MFN3_ALLMI|nr:hypothetical protein Y1Q_0005716 [Alligator mississippiensis]